MSVSKLFNAFQGVSGRMFQSGFRRLRRFPVEFEGGFRFGNSDSEAFYSVSRRFNAFHSRRFRSFEGPLLSGDFHSGFRE